MKSIEWYSVLLKYSGVFSGRQRFAMNVNDEDIISVALDADIAPVVFEIDTL